MNEQESAMDKLASVTGRLREAGDEEAVEVIVSLAKDILVHDSRYQSVMDSLYNPSCN